MKSLKDYLDHEHFDVEDKFAPACLLQRALYTQTKLANIVWSRFPLLYKSYYNVSDLEFDLHIELLATHSTEMHYVLTTSQDLEDRFAKFYPEKLI